MKAEKGPELVREVGRWNLAALAINTSIGSAIFGLPVVIAQLVGGASPIAYVVAGVGMAIIALCLAEVSSRFREAGGPYLYARVAFGRFAGLQVGWALWLVRIAGGAANANLFTVYLGEFWKGTTEPVTRVALITAIVGLLAAINYCGVRYGARMSTILAVAKLLPLTLFCVAGLFFLNPAHFRAGVGAGTAEWTQAILLMVFAYGGFESATIPAAELGSWP